jgi:hypothetical protein
VERELDEELRFHFDRQVEKYMKSGMAEQEARRRARLAFGRHEQVKEDCREVHGTGFIGLTMRDSKYAFRQLWANPTFALVMIATLALSIGANCAIFSVIQGVLLKRLPYHQPDRLVRIFLSSREYPKFPLNPFDFLDFRARNHSFDSIAAFTRGDVQLSGEGEPVRVNGFGITSGYFRVLGLHPELGREFDFQAEIAGNGLQVILSDRVWRTRFWRRSADHRPQDDYEHAALHGDWRHASRNRASRQRLPRSRLWRKCGCVVAVLVRGRFQPPRVAFH